MGLVLRVQYLFHSPRSPMVQEAQDEAVEPMWVEDHKDSRPTSERSTRIRYDVLTANTSIFAFHSVLLLNTSEYNKKTN